MKGKKQSKSGGKGKGGGRCSAMDCIPDIWRGHAADYVLGPSLADIAQSYEALHGRSPFVLVPTFAAR